MLSGKAHIEESAMRKAYLNLARLIALLIVVQAMSITFAVAGLFNWITEKGGAVNSSVVEGWEDHPPTFTGAVGHAVHSLSGENVIPIVALLLLIVSFFAKVPKGVAMASVIFVLVILQVYSGVKGDEMPYLGLWHGLGALLIFGAAIGAAMAAKAAPAPVVTSPAE